MIDLSTVEIDRLGNVLSVSSPAFSFLNDLLPTIGDNLVECWDKNTNVRMKDYVESIFESSYSIAFLLEINHHPIQFTAHHYATDKAFVYCKPANAETPTEKKNQQQLKLVDFAFRNANVAIFFVKADGSFYDCNEETYQLLGYIKEEFLGLEIYDLDSKVDRDYWKKAWTRHENLVDDVVYTKLKKKDSTFIDVKINTKYIEYDGLEVLCSFLTDITEKKRADERLQLVDFSFRKVGTAIVYSREDGSLYGYNDAYRKLYGYEEHEMKDLTMFDFGTSFDPVSWKEYWAGLKANKISSFTAKRRRKDGTEIVVEINPNYIKYGELELNCAFVTDVTEKKKIEERLKLVDFSYRNAATPILLLLPNASFYDFNDAMVQLLGYTKEEFSLLTIPDIDPSFDKALCKVRWDEFRKIQRATFLNKLKKKDGSFVDVEIRNNLITYGETEINFCFITDITEKKRLEDKLKIVDHAFRNATIPMHFINRDGTVYDCNDAACELFGYSKEEYKKLTLFDFSTRHTPETWVERWESLKTRSELPHITKLKKKDNTLVDVEVRTDILQYENANLCFTSFIDITEKKKVEETIRVINQRYEYATLATSDVIWETDVVNDMLYLSPSFTTVFGNKTSGMEYGPENIWRRNVHPEDLARTLDSEAAAIKGTGDKWEVEYRFKKADGKYAIVMDRGYALKDETGKVIRLIGAMQDITKRKEEELRLKLMESVILNTNEAVVITDAEPYELPGPKIVFVNEAYTRMTGFTNEEAIGQTPRITQNEHTQRSELDKVAIAFEKWEPFDITVLNATKTGEEFWVNVRATPVADEKGWFTHWVAIQRDVTKEKEAEAEKEKLLNILVQNNKELTQFSYITTHNLRAPLTNLISICNLIKTDNIEDERTQKLIEGFKISTHYLNDTLNDLIKVLIIKENPQWDTEQVLFQEVLDKVKTSIYMKLTNMVVTVKADFADAVSVIFSNAYMESIFLNLITNSLRYAHPQRYPIITIKTFKQADGITKLVYTDNGIGMNIERVKNKIFGLYQRFHNNPDGKGMGLYLIHSQITTLGGKIEVESEEGVGTTFTVTFK